MIQSLDFMSQIYSDSHLGLNLGWISLTKVGYHPISYTQKDKHNTVV